MSLSLVVGLGNPGRDYDGTRHNAGFAVVDALARSLDLAWETSRRFEAEIARGELTPEHPVLLVKPLTFMNASGRAVQALASFHRVPANAIVAVYDDLNIPLGLVKVSVTGSAGGHNGVASLLAQLGDGFIRYRVGIGPKEPVAVDMADFVLARFSDSQKQLFDQQLSSLTSGLRFVLTDGADRAMNQLNRLPNAQ